MKLHQTLHISCVLMAAACLAGCASHGKWPALDESRDQLVLVAGHFTGFRELDELPCGFTSEDYDTGTVDCLSGTPAVTTLNVYEVVHGKLPKPRIEVAYIPSLRRSDRPPGSGEPMLVLLRSDGKHYILTSLKREIAQTSRGDWAMPVYENEMLTILPCGAEPLVRPMRFASPVPGDALENVDEDNMARLKVNPRVRLGASRFTITHGVLLSDMRKFMAENAPADPQEYYCSEYERDDLSASLVGR